MVDNNPLFAVIFTNPNYITPNFSQYKYGFSIFIAI